jgi:hypothetical protein
MHQRTYEGLIEKLCDCEDQREAALAAFIGRLMVREPRLRDDPFFSDHV